jgi:hypothetical protein
MFISVLAIAIAANRADDSGSWLQQKHREHNPGASARGPSSVGGKKDIVFAQKDMMKHTHKVRGPLAAVVELVGQRPEQPGDVFVLKGVVSSESSLTNVEFTWRVPEGVEVVNGQTSSVIAVLSEGKPFETQITLRQVSPSNARVTLRVRGRDAGMRFGDTAVYHTMDQQKLEAARLELKSTAEEYMKGSSGKGSVDSPAGEGKKALKIFH